MATKNELTQMCEDLVHQIAKKHGAKIVDKTITVGGKETKSKGTDGGLFDIPSARSLLLASLRKNQELLINVLDSGAAATPAE